MNEERGRGIRENDVRMREEGMDGGEGWRRGRERRRVRRGGQRERWKQSRRDGEQGWRRGREG